MILKLQKIEKLINSELSSKIKNSSIENEELLIEIDESDLKNLMRFLLNDQDYLNWKKIYKKNKLNIKSR